MWNDKKWSITDWINDHERYILEKQFICSFDNGYYFADKRRFMRYETFPEELKIFLNKDTIKIATKSNDVIVFYWNNNNLLLKSDCDNIQ